MGVRDGVAKMISTQFIIKGALGCKNPRRLVPSEFIH